ncbi:MAG: isoleucine--tRNA ligase [Firmicutes bacterium]|nr:isoleucine--tRNA ligase [Bacillota bacterium]
MEYKNTLNLPQASFPMRVNLPEMEGKILDFWQKEQIYKKVRSASNGKTKFTLLDGPPYTNGPIHMGQTFNKILKDIIVRYKTLRGFSAPFIPGWDAHGLPTEILTIKSHKLDRKNTTSTQLRQKCAETAFHYAEIQKEQFKRIGVFADWENPYMTLDPGYESEVIRIFGKLADENYIYRGLKPVYWCTDCETALAEAEIEYRNKKSAFAFVKFQLKNSLKLASDFMKPVSLLVWTSAPWTLSGSAAVAVNPDEIYCLAEINGEGLIMADPLLDYVMEQCSIEDYNIVSSFKGSELASYTVTHPFADRELQIIAGEYVRMDQGTGCVQIAPGLGREDYEAAVKYNLPVKVPVNEYGILFDDACLFKGMHYSSAEGAMLEYLKKNGKLLKSGDFENSHAHCWRCRKPVISRAASQWFIAVDINNLRAQAMEQVEVVKWQPYWGADRISNMLRERPDWCISRQRVWGIPIPAVKCMDCGREILDSHIIEQFRKITAVEGSGVWFDSDVKRFIPDGFTCPYCDSTDIEKTYEIFDVWFESGLAAEAVSKIRSDISIPVDLCVEGSDQHRGWFQSSLLPSVALRGKAPFREVLTHGWVLDEEGKSMHKSLGNYIDPIEVVSERGADILRLLIASSDYASDISVTEESLEQSQEAYRKFRNTARFILGNIEDFDPESDYIETGKMAPQDRWLLYRKDRIVKDCLEHFENYQFHKVVRILHNFCVQDLSRFYFVISKSILYYHSKDSVERRSSQTALYETLKSLTCILAPFISFTAEEIWQSYRPFTREAQSVMLSFVSVPETVWMDETEESRWEIFLELRRQIFEEAEKLRKSGKISGISEARVSIHTAGNVLSALGWNIELFRRIIGAPVVEIHEWKEREPKNALPSASYPRTFFIIDNFKGEKCKRCRSLFPDLLEGEICLSCNEVVNRISAEDS